MELLKYVLARSLVVAYNFSTSTKRDLYINAFNSYQLVSWYQHHQGTTPFIYERTCLIRSYHMQGNYVRIHILLRITRTSLNNAKVRCIGKDEYVYEFVCP